MTVVEMNRDEMIHALRVIANPLVMRDVGSKMVQGIGPVMCREWVEWPEDPAVGDLVWVRTGIAPNEGMALLVWDGERWV